MKFPSSTNSLIFFSRERERERGEIFKNSQFLIVCGIGGESDTRYSYKKMNSSMKAQTVSFFLLERERE